MKTFKRTLSCFLALLMIFGSFSVLSFAAGDKNATFYTKFFVDEKEVTEVKAGDTVKARVYIATDYVVAASNFFWVYSKNFMDLDTSGLTPLNNGFEAGPLFNTSATSIPAVNQWDGYLVTATEPGGASSGDAADNLVYDGYLTEDFFADKGWIALNVNKGSPVQLTADEFIFEFTFTVKDSPEGEGFFYIEPEAVQDTDYYDYAYTFVGEHKTSTAFGSVEGWEYDYTYDYQDTNTIKLAAPETPTHAVTYTYAGEIPAGATAPEAIQVEEGATISNPTVTIPAGYQLTWAMSGATDGKMGTSDVTMTGTWSKIVYNVTYTYEGDIPDGYTAPAAETTTVGEALALPTVTAPTGYTLTWAVTGATKNEHGVYIADANDVEFVGTWAKSANAVTYTFTNAGPEGVDAPAAGETTVGATIAAPAVDVPDGWTLSWTAIGATKNDDGTYTAGNGDVTFVGTWAKTSYNVTYSFANEAPNSITAPAAGTTTVGATIAAPTTVAPAGYTLEWAVTGATKNDDGTYTAGANDVAFVGTWSKISYDVTYSFANEAPNGITAPAAGTTTVGATIAAPATVAPAGYTLTWAVNGATKNEDGSYTAGANNVTFVGTWATIEYNVTYTFEGTAPEGEEAPAAGKTTVGATIAAPTTVAPDGYTLEWTVTGATKNADGSYTAAANDVAFVGTWAKIPYTITYYLSEADKAAGKVYDTKTYTVGDAVTAIADPQVDGKIFDAWDIDHPATMPANNLEAVAIFSDIVVTFYDVWGDPLVDYSMEVVTEITDADLPSEDDAKAGEDVNFVEWQIDGAKLVTPYELEGSVDVYPYCTVNIVYYTDDDLATVHKTYTFDFGHIITAADIADLGEPARKLGHDFDGWDVDYVDQEATANNYAVATWAPNTYTATFTAGDGAFAEGTATTADATFGEAIEFTAEPILEGYTFTGWTDVENSTTALDELVMDAEGKTFYPVFIKNGDVAYTVEIYLMDETGAYGAPKKETGSAAFGTTVTVDHDDYTQEAYFSADTAAANVFTAVVAEDGSTTLKLYYKRATVEITVNGEKDEYFVGEEIPAPTVDPDTIPDGYEQDETNPWIDENGDPVNVPYEVKEDGNPTEIKPNIVASTDTKYSVEIYLMDEEGNYGAASDVKEEAGTTDTKATAAHADYAQDAWFSADTAAANVTEATITGDGKATLKLYYARAQYDVAIDGAAAVKVYHGATVTAPETSTATPAGYTLESWNDGAYTKGQVITVTEALTLAPKFAANTDTKYSVEIYLMDEEGNYGAASDVKEEAGTTDTLATAAHADYAQDAWFSADAEAANVTEATITGDGKAVLKLYYARAQYDVAIDGAAAVKVYHGATVTAPETSTATPAGYTLESWNDGAYTKGQVITVTEALTLAPKFAANTDTKYSVEIYLMDEEGNYGAASDVKEEAGTTDTLATAAHADYAPAETYFSADTAAANVTEATITGDGKAVLKLYYKRATVEITVNGEKDEYFVGEEIPAPAVDPDTIPDGYEQDKTNPWVDENGDPVEVPYEVKENGNPTEIKPNIVEKDGISYSVEIYLQDAEGNYPAAASKTETESGKTGESVTIAHADYAQEAYYLADAAEANVYEGTIAGDGSLVLKLYFKRATYDVIVDGEVVAEDVIHGAEVTLPEESDNIDEGNVLDGWTDGKNTYEPGETIVVEGPLDITPVQKPSDATKYTISIYMMDTDGSDYVGTSTVSYGTTGATQTIVPDYSREGFTVNTEKSKLTGTIAADGSLVLSVYYDRNLYTATFDGVDYQVYYGASLPTVEPAAQEGNEFDAWTPAVPATMPAEDLEFTSTWTDVMYKLIYIINGAEEEYKYAAGATVTPIADPVVPGMTFIKWNKTVPTVMPAEDVIIVAEFEAAVFKVTFLDGEGNVFDEKAVQYGDTIVLPTTNPTKEYHVFNGWIDVPATMPAANVTIYPDFERVPVRLVPAEGSTTVIDRETMIITGLTTKMNDAKAANYLAIEGDGYYTLTSAEGYTGFYGTGAKVEVYDNADTSAPIEVFYIVIYGDVNGDSAVNSADGSIVEDEVLYVTSWSRGDSKDALMIMAADLNKDGKIKQGDSDSIINSSLGITKIDQVSGTVIR